MNLRRRRPRPGAARARGEPAALRVGRQAEARGGVRRQGASGPPRTATSPPGPTKKAGPRSRARGPKSPLRDRWRSGGSSPPRSLGTIWRQKPVRTTGQCDPPPSTA